jgi:hypothetical protein
LNVFSKSASVLLVLCEKLIFVRSESFVTRFLELCVRVVAGVSVLMLVGCNDTPEPDRLNLEGKWRFKTTGDYEGYVNGSLTIKPPGEAGPICKLTVYQSEFGSAVEACGVSFEDGKVIIEIQEVLTSSVPNWRQERFVLDPGSDEMSGVVRLVVDFPVTFIRQPSRM